jgi:hypothetical protein
MIQRVTTPKSDWMSVELPWLKTPPPLASLGRWIHGFGVDVPEWLET